MTPHEPPAFRPNPVLPFGDHKETRFYGTDVISVKQFDRKDLDYIFAVAKEMQGMVRRVGTFDLLKGKILANLFYEPSTRTSASFTSAMERLGGSVIPINEVKYSSVSKGESLPDTIRSLECYADVIVLRHPKSAPPPLPQNTPANRSSMPVTVWANTPPRRCSTCSPSTRKWAASTV
jgi:aspartate carbamoyltransferase catalytic subunit